MNIKLVKRVAVASLAALVIILNLNVLINNNVNTVYARIHEEEFACINGLIEKF